MLQRSDRRLTALLAALTTALVVTLASGGVVIEAADAATSPTSPTSATPITSVTIKGYKYFPNKFTVSTGTPITVKNRDGATHDLAAVNGAFKTKYIEGGKAGKFRVKKPGTYKIVCTLHTYMTGKLTAT